MRLIILFIAIAIAAGAFFMTMHLTGVDSGAFAQTPSPCGTQPAIPPYCGHGQAVCQCDSTGYCAWLFENCRK